ncbi:MAG TPA: class I SAM-dependent methyltransferase [Spirochaetota bacterium]|nr:class I SAM-dependent methyltransferase [Spirochaetota bacterium]
MRFKNHDYAEFYDRQQTEAGYPGKLLAPVIEALKGFNSVIDIGAGTGFFTIPLLESGHRVTVVEPASEMSDIILRKCPPGKREKLSVINDLWENWTGEKHDAAICIHSLYSMNNSRNAIELIHRNSEKRIIIVRESSEMKTLTGMTRAKLGIELSRDYNPEIVSALKELDVPFTVKNIMEQRPHRVIDPDRETGSVIYHLRLDESYKNRVRNIINELCSKDSRGIYFNAVYSDNIYLF